MRWGQMEEAALCLSSVIGFTLRLGSLGKNSVMGAFWDFCAPASELLRYEVIQARTENGQMCPHLNFTSGAPRRLRKASLGGVQNSWHTRKNDRGCQLPLPSSYCTVSCLYLFYFLIGHKLKIAHQQFSFNRIPTEYIFLPSHNPRLENIS